MKTFNQLIEEEMSQDGYEEYDDEVGNLFDQMLDFILDLDPDTLSDDQVNTLDNIIDQIDDSDDFDDETYTTISSKNNDTIDDGVEGFSMGMEIDEAAPARKVRRDLKAKRIRARKYRQKKAAIKRKAKLFRKTAKFRKFKKKQKRMARLGKTSSGKRKRTFINK